MQQSLHVRFIFQLSIPLHGDFQGAYSFNIASDGIGIIVKNQNSLDEWYYQVQLLSCDGDTELDATKGLTWPKRNLYVLQTKENTQIEGLVLRLKIIHGTFDFRKVKRRAIRFNVNCFQAGAFIGRGASEICQLLPKKRTAGDSDVNGEVLVPIIWSQNNETQQELPLFQPLPLKSEQTDEFPSSDEERPQKRQRLDPPGQQSLLSEDSASPHEIHNTVPENYDVGMVYESPVEESADAELSPYYAHQENTELISNIDETSPHDLLMAREHTEQYMVLYNGNAEVVGNFRALNFYKASDINIKEDIRLLVEDRDPRNVILKIDGVEYKFKDNVQHSTNKRFVGYIAQQIESVVPEAVQLIDGILHVDYESLIPYLSESIKQIRKLLDSLYAEFISKQPNKGEKSKKTPSTVRTQSRRRVWLIPAILVPLVFVLGAAVGIFFMVNSHGLTPYTPPGHITPLTNVSEPLINTPVNLPPSSPDRDVLMKLFVALNGTNWLRKDGWGNASSVCTWKGITCSKDRVTGIHLANNNLVGTLPEELGQLEIMTLDLADNDLQGSIPESVWSLGSLDEVVVSNNKNLTGTLPSTFRGETLELAGCNFQGTIPPNFFTGRLYSVNISSNALVGTIPEIPFSRKIPGYLDLSHNRLTGSIPSLFVLGNLFLSYNQLSGNLSALFLSHVTMNGLDLSHNNLEGDFYLPVDTPMYNILDVSYNKFSSCTYKLYASAVNYCDASQNEFKCPIPKWLKNECRATCN